MNLTLNKLIHLAILLCVSTILYSQNDLSLNIELGKVFKNEKREIPVDIIGGDDKGYYLLYSEGRFGQGDDMKIRRFNLDFTPSGQEINLKNNIIEGTFKSLGVTKVKDKIVHVFYILNADGKHYYHQTIDLNAFSKGSTEFITTVENDTKKARNSTSRFMISDDEETITMFYTIPNKNKELTKIKIQTFDSSFNKLDESDYAFPYQNAQFSIHGIYNTIDNGMIFICKKYNTSKILREENNKGYEFLIYKLNNNSMERIAKIKPKDVHMRYLNSNFVDNKLLLTGLYSSNNIYAMKGVYSSQVNLDNGEISNEVYNDFDASFITKLMKDSKRKDRTIRKIGEGKFEDPNYILDEVKVLPNGEILVLAEQRRTVTTNYVTTFFHENIAIMKLDVDGKLVWANKIGKNNTKANVPIYNSFFSFFNNGNLYLLYNCNQRNINHTVGQIANSFVGERAFISAKVNKEGNYKRKVLITREASEGITIRPQLYNWINESTLLLFGQDIDNLKNQRFAKLTF